MRRLTGLTLVTQTIFVLVSFVPADAAEKSGSVLDYLDSGNEPNSLPIWKKPTNEDAKEFHRVARNAAQGVMIIGNRGGGFGTGFVISSKHRLVATNAHVADIKHHKGSLLAIRNGTSEPYSVNKVWYHPRLIRMFDESFSSYSMDPKDGEVDPQSPDLAVLQLGPGPELPFEFKLASYEDVKDLFARPVVMIGFPGHDTKDFPALGVEVQATAKDGLVSRLTDFKLNPSVASEDRQFVQHSVASCPGFSGSPIFLADGSVVAIHNMSRPETVKGKSMSIAHGIRADCLTELLTVHPDLNDLVAHDHPKRNHLKSDLEPLNQQAFRRAVQLVAEARHLIDVEQKFDNGIEKCNEALKLAPDYPRAYITRSAALTNDCFLNADRKKLTKRAKRLQLNMALEDAIKYAKLAPSQPIAYERIATILNNLGFLDGDPSKNRDAQKLATKLIESDHIDNRLRSGAYSQRGIAKANLGDDIGAEADLNKAIKLNPESDMNYLNRASFLKSAGRFVEAEADKREANRLQKKIDKP